MPIGDWLHYSEFECRLVILAALSAKLNDLFILSHALCAKLNDLSLLLHAVSAKLDGKTYIQCESIKRKPRVNFKYLRTKIRITKLITGNGSIIIFLSYDTLVTHIG